MVAEGPGRRRIRQDISRRGFLVGATAAGFTMVAAGCSGDDDEAGDGGGHGGGGSATPTTQHTARLSGDPFALGVASGDPLADRVILWTRLAPTPLTPGTGGMPDDRVDVVWQVASDERFTRMVTQGVATAEPARAHSVHVDAEGLDPASEYFYRFSVGDWTSRVGRTRTAAAIGEPLDRLALGVVTCQYFDLGYYAAYRHLLDENVDLVVHLGDYIYEIPLGTDRQVLPESLPVSLDDYRLRYASYRSDPDLQAAHARYAFMTMWDDHEVANNYASDTFPSGAPAEEVRAQKAAAYRAYWEHLPVRLSPPDGPDVTLYRSATFGDLARLYLLDERQYADEPPCRDTASGDFGNCPARTEDREYLGTEQDAWFAEQSGQGGVTWNLVGNPSVVAGVNVGDVTNPRYFLDTWDGYPAARRRFVEHLARDEVTNPIVLTGDWHAGMVNDVHADPEDRTTPVVATELMTPAISSPIFGSVPRDLNPHMRYLVEKHGYMTVVVEPEQLTATFRILDDVGDASSGITTDATWRIAAGGVTASPA